MPSFLAVLCIIMVAVGLRAQNDTTEVNRGVGGTTSKYKLSVGPALSFFGSGLNTLAAEGRKTRNDFYVLPSYGVAIYAPFGTNVQMGGRLDLGITSVGTRTRPYEFFDGKTSWEGYIIERYQYFTIAPSVNLAGVTLGAGFNFPLAGQMWHPDRSSEKFDIDKSTMKTAIDVRIGSMIKVWSTNVGTLFVELQAKYYLTGLYNEGKYTMGNTVDAKGFPNQDFRTYEMLNMVPASAQLGVSYLFDLSL